MSLRWASNHLEESEVVRSSAGAGTMYPPFSGYSRGTPQCMKSIDNPLLNHHFGRQHSPPTNFSILTPQRPLYLGTAFLGVGGGGLA